MPETWVGGKRVFDVAVIGPDHFTDYELVAAKLDVLLAPKLADKDVIAGVIHIGGAFARLVERWAEGRAVLDDARGLADGAGDSLLNRLFDPLHGPHQLPPALTLAATP